MTGVSAAVVGPGVATLDALVGGLVGVVGVVGVVAVVLVVGVVDVLLDVLVLVLVGVLVEGDVVVRVVGFVDVRGVEDVVGVGVTCCRTVTVVPWIRSWVSVTLWFGPDWRK